MTTALSEMSVDELEEQITTWAGRVAAGEARLIDLLGEFEEREGWVGTGILSCAHWASWRLGMSLSTSREKLRVARCLRTLPATRRRFAAGELSYAQVRAITRIATAEDEDVWLRLAPECTASQLDRAVRGVRRSKRSDDAVVDPQAQESRRRDEVRVSWTEDGDLVVTMRIPAPRAPAVMASLEAATAKVQTERDAQLAALVAQAVSGATAGDPPAGGSAETGPRPERARPTAASSTQGDHAASHPSAGGWLPDLEGVVPDAGNAYRELTEAFPEGIPDSYVFVEPDYPVDFDQPRTQPKEVEEGLIAVWREELEQRRRRRNAWRAWQEQLALVALSAHVPLGRATLADGLIRLLTEDPTGASRVKVQLLVDPLSGWARTAAGELLSPDVLGAIVDGSQNRPQLPRVRPLTAEDLTRFDQGRRSRLVNPQQRALLGHLDGERCRMPGCTRVRRLHAHHVEFWRNGGRTDLANLLLLCSRHHTLVHAMGFQLILRADRSLTVHTQDGLPVPHRPALPSQPAEDLDKDRVITPTTLPTRWNGDRMDLHHVVWVLRQHAA